MGAEAANPRGGQLAPHRAQGDGRFYLTIDPDGTSGDADAGRLRGLRGGMCLCAVAQREDGHAWRLPTRSSGEGCQGVCRAIHGVVAGPAGHRTCCPALRDRSSPTWGPSQKTAARTACWTWVGTASGGRSTTNPASLRLKDGHAVMPQVESGASRLVCGKPGTSSSASMHAPPTNNSRVARGLGFGWCTACVDHLSGLRDR